MQKKNGFVPFDRDASYKAGDKVYYNNRDKSLILAVIGKEGCKMVFVWLQPILILHVWI